MASKGDVVQLASGGTKMTVEAVEGDQVHCVYNTSNGVVRRETFDAALLKDANEEKVSINIFMGGEKVEK